MPFQLHFNSVNRSQTLFGVEKGYLRSHFHDYSYMREWTMHRMLARFGLPYLRSRSVRLYIRSVSGNQATDHYFGLYTFIEAPDQEYVFARSFPDYDPSNFALYKVKYLSRLCGRYSEQQILFAPQISNETVMPFKRGEHRAQIPQHDKFWGVLSWGLCLAALDNSQQTATSYIVAAWLRSGRDCGRMLVEEGLIDRDLGTKASDSKMAEFINKYLHHEGGQTPGLETAVDQDNLLRNFAVYAVTLGLDSPLGNGNNFYLADSGDGKGWKLVQYDHNMALQNPGGLCPACSENPLRWAITRPGCGPSAGIPLLGPLLAQPELLDGFIEHVRNFTLTVFLNTSLHSEMRAHAAALEPFVQSDPWSMGYKYSNELQPAPWLETHNRNSMVDSTHYLNLRRVPLVPFVESRGSIVKDQLDAIDNGSFVMPEQVNEHVACQVAPAPGPVQVLSVLPSSSESFNSDLLSSPNVQLSKASTSTNNTGVAKASMTNVLTWGQITRILMLLLTDISARV